MRKQTKEKIVVLLMALGLVSSYVVIWAQQKSARPAPTAARTAPAPQPSPAELIKGYRDWAKVNPKPVTMQRNVAALCAAPIPTGALQSASHDNDNPHLDKYITVYVNETGRKDMLENIAPKFPVGSVIVKEKLPEQTSNEPELLTVMVKRKAGFNSPSGDWEYFVLDGKGQKTEAQGKLESCNACHIAVKDSDYVFRSYLPADVKLKLK